MKEKNEYMEKVYEKFAEDMKPTKEMKEVYDKFIEKTLTLKNSFNDEQVKMFEELEDLFSELTSLEVKQAFFKGYSVATNLNIEARKEE